MEIPAILDSLQVIIPELILVTGLLFILFWDLITGFREKQQTGYIAFGTLLLGLLLTLVDMERLGSDLAYGGHIQAFMGTIQVDGFGLFLKGVFFLSALIVTALSFRQKDVPFLGQAEYYSLILSITLAASLLAQSMNLIVILISFEFLSIPQYILSGSKKSEKESVEASLKYVIYGSVASGAMLFGFSLLYGFSGGQIDLLAIQDYMIANAETFSIAERFGLGVIVVLILAGMGFKISAVPFHMWTPDVYQGTPVPAVALFSVVPKAAGFAFMTRFFLEGLGGGLPNMDWQMILAAISVLSMTLGNLAALWQNNIKRLLAYSSIAHAGYILIGVLIATRSGTSALLFYLVGYMIMNLGIFTAVIALIAATGGRESISSYSGLGWHLPGIGVPMIGFAFSLIGLPPTVGFFGKFFLFEAGVSAGWEILIVIALLNTVVSLYYYLRIVKVMYLEKPSPGEKETLQINHILPAHRVLIVGLGIAVVLFGVYPSPLISLAKQASLVFFA